MLIECIHDVTVLLTHHLTCRAITAKIKSKAVLNLLTKHV